MLATTTYVESNSSPAPTAKPAGLCYKHTAGEDQNQYVRMAARISNNDVRFLALLDAENGLWTSSRQSEVWINGYRERSYGFCQIHKPDHPEIINDPRFSDPQWQLEACYRLYKGGTKFYGARNISKTIKNFTCK